MVRRDRALTLLVCFGILLVLSGCLRRVQVVTRERVDQELAGNRGVLQGPVPTTPSKASPTRQYVEWDIEVPSYEVRVRVPEWRREWHDKELWGNRGYLVGGPGGRPAKETVVSPSPPPAPVSKRPFFGERKIEKPAPSYTTYTVKKGDTLGHISSQHYGTAKEWKRIYEANRDLLEDPNRLKPGQSLRIPPFEGETKSPSRTTLK